MEKKWTPGPWEVVRHVTRPAVEAINKKRGMRAAGDKYPLVCTMPDNYSTTESNAHLIAAAPELYEALEALLYGIENCDRIENYRIENAIDALAKARGE